MPLIRIVPSTGIVAEARPAGTDALLRELSALLARELRKPESYVMTCLESPARMTFGGTDAPTCYVEIKNVGTLTPETTARLSATVTERLSSAFGVSGDRIYIEFADARPHMWGHDGATFA
jgi:phenylpyruvate tautomerase PptA (4-oxalocrotonate tautomerase family)